MSLLLDALRKAEKVKGARASGRPGEAADGPLLAEEFANGEPDGHGLALVEMVHAVEAPAGRRESALMSSGGQPPDPVHDQVPAAVAAPGGAVETAEFTMGRGEARSLFELNGESAYRRRWRWVFIGTGITLIVGLSVYYGWLLYVAVKPSAALVPRQPSAATATTALPAPPLALANEEADAAAAPVAAVPGGENVSISAADDAAPGMEVQTAREMVPARDLSVTGVVIGERPVSALNHTEGEASAADSLSSGSEPERAPLSIKRSRRQDPVFPRLTRAYQAYRAGDHAQAEADYRFVLSQRPDNRDALLGMAALALSKGRTDEAVAAYRRILEISPGDRAALAALSSIPEDNDPQESEKRLRRLLASAPDAAYLHFALGNLYAAQERWPEAQQAYFNAYRHDSDNGDYAYNLAVGLEHLGQPQAALRYYRKALEVAARENVGFEPETVRRRVQMISKSFAVSGP